MSSGNPPDVAPPEREDEREGGGKRTLVKGFAYGIGSAAIVAALLYANRNRPKRRD